MKVNARHYPNSSSGPLEALALALFISPAESFRSSARNAYALPPYAPLHLPEGTPLRNARTACTACTAFPEAHAGSTCSNSLRQCLTPALRPSTVQLIDNANFKHYLELVPEIREVIKDFYDSRYTTCLSALDRMKVPFGSLGLGADPQVGAVPGCVESISAVSINSLSTAVKPKKEVWPVAAEVHDPI